MRKEFWRKAQQCDKCIYHCPEGMRPGSLEPDTHWKEACRFCGTAFWQKLEMAEICYDFATDLIDLEGKDKKEKDVWARRHLCSKCAFYGMNGFEIRDKNLYKEKEDWDDQLRCRGYVHIPDKEPDGLCASFLSMDQWSIVELAPVGAERIRRWNAFRNENIKGILAANETEPMD